MQDSQGIRLATVGNRMRDPMDLDLVLWDPSYVLPEVLISVERPQKPLSLLSRIFCLFVTFVPWIFSKELKMMFTIFSFYAHNNTVELVRWTIRDWLIPPMKLHVRRGDLNPHYRIRIIEKWNWKGTVKASAMIFIPYWLSPLALLQYQSCDKSKGTRETFCWGHPKLYRFWPLLLSLTTSPRSLWRREID